MNAYEAKQEARRERLEARAEKLDKVAAAEFRKADLREEASGIPFGQPILVGHHSERRHRNAIDKAHRAMGRGVEASKAADHARERAAGVGHGGISSDDPDAVDKLKAKQAKLEALAAWQLAANKLIAAGKIDQLDASDEEKAKIASMVERWPYMARGYFHVSNRRAEIRRLKLRIEQLGRNAARPAAAPVELAGGVRLVENVEANRVQLIFPGKPDADVRAKLKREGFRWAPSEGAWQRHLNNAGRHAAKCVVDALSA
jgi:hypothetical protein